jgi:hypothetical protein
LFKRKIIFLLLLISEARRECNLFLIHSVENSSGEKDVVVLSCVKSHKNLCNQKDKKALKKLASSKAIDSNEK